MTASCVMELFYRGMLIEKDQKLVLVESIKKDWIRISGCDIGYIFQTK
ncbi:hypothetical protein PTHTG4_33440 [Parageobacillus thermoglucosidasius]|nr:hypothetical protein PTHTG4_33440 [Parageobacillus thermoglucosidasius]